MKDFEKTAREIVDCWAWNGDEFQEVRDTLISDFVQALKDAKSAGEQEKAAALSSAAQLVSGRCKHDVHGTDCYECYPTPKAQPGSVSEWNDGRYHWIELNGKKYRLLTEEEHDATITFAKYAEQPVSEKLSEKTIEVCPKCGSSEKEWMQRSPDGDSKCKGCDYVGPHTTWEKFKPYGFMKPTPNKAVTDEVREALRDLVVALHSVHISPEYMRVFETAMIHNGPYTGPSYKKELDRAREKLGVK